MQSYAFFDHLTSQSWQTLVENTSELQKADIGFIHSPDGKKHPIRSSKEQSHLTRMLRDIWVEKQVNLQHLDSEEVAVCSKNFDWLFAQAKRRILGSKMCPILTVKEAVRVLQNIDQYQVVNGQGITPFEFLRTTEGVQPLCLDPVVSKVLRYCWGDPEISTLDVGNLLPKKTLMIGPAETMNETACRACKDVFKRLLVQLRQESSIHPRLATIAIKNMLALLPYFEPKEGSVFNVPVYLEGKWTPVEYTVNRIQVSGRDYPFSPYYAYGMLPTKTEPQAPPHLLFMGTTYPAASGGFFTYLADLHPFKSVGMWAFEQGREAIGAFLEKAFRQTGQKSHVAGQSLGGCMTLHAATEFHEYIEQAHAFSPAALLSRDLAKWDALVDSKKQTPEVHVYRQQHDSVPMFGNTWGEGWNINYVKGFVMKGSVEGHIRIGAAAKAVTISQIQETVRPSLRRRVLGLVHRIMGSVLFAFGIAFVATTRLVINIKKSFAVAGHNIAHLFASRQSTKDLSLIHATRLFTP